MEYDNIRFSNHAKQRLEERNIKEQWVIDTLQNPDAKEIKSENEVHFFKQIFEFAKRYLKVVFNPMKNLVVTAYFDRSKTKAQ